jgi:lipid-A-disaccharide synthase
MLTLFPFEADFYHEHNVPVEFVGHPLANELSNDHDVESARQELGLSSGKETVAIMPGSRGGEVSLIAPAFLQAARLSFQKQPELQFVIPAANELRYQQISKLLEDYSDVPITLVLGKSQLVMKASNALMIASGTTSLEAMLLGKPTIVGYRMAWLSYKIISSLVKVDYIALPNLLANKLLIPEFIQENLVPEQVCDTLLKILNDAQYVESIKSEFDELSVKLRRNASLQAANAIFALINTPASGKIT